MRVSVPYKRVTVIAPTILKFWKDEGMSMCVTLIWGLRKHECGSPHLGLGNKEAMNYLLDNLMPWEPMG